LSWQHIYKDEKSCFNETKDRNFFFGWIALILAVPQPYSSVCFFAPGFSQQDACHDLTPEQWAVLLGLREQEGLNQNQLGEKTFKDRHNITRILKQLDKRGYIEKLHDKKDKRAFHVYLSPAGRSLIKKLKPVGKIWKNGDLEYLLLLQLRRRLYMVLYISFTPFLMNVLMMHMWRAFKFGGISKWKYHIKPRFYPHSSFPALANSI
jgi:DNA-binding MarR family transcriptional regulator